MVQLAIKGHASRHKEVIKLLERLGGKNDNSCYGGFINRIYFINENGYIESCDRMDHLDYLQLTVEEFLENFPYKVGDKVLYHGCKAHITSMRWDGKEIIYIVNYNDALWEANMLSLQPYKEENVDKVVFGANAQCCDIMNHLIKKEIMEERKYADLRLDVDQDDKLATEATIDGDKITPPENYLIGKITKVDNGMIVEFVKKQPQYPKTYEECCGVLKIPNDERYIDIDVPLDYNKVLSAFTKLLICRNAYWKIAGEQMGLGKPWEFKLGSDSKEVVYAISVFGTGIMLDFYYALNCNKILAFPTKEMRDAFLENFKELIEKCKELL